MDRERTAADAMGRAGGASGRRASAELDDWRQSMARMSERHNRLVAEGKWLSGPSDMLGVVELARNEMVHTRLLAWLLDPRRKHRLGDAVLQALLGHMASQEVPDVPCPAASGDGTPCRCSVEPREAPDPPVVRHVAVSHWCNGREADIVVFGWDFTLVIEVKVDAPEQCCQCNDLYKNYGDQPDPWFLFLTPGGWRPCSATGCAQRAFKTASWKDVREMIERALGCRGTSPPGLGTGIPVEYAITLKEQFR